MSAAAAVTTRRIRRRAQQFRGFKAAGLARTIASAGLEGNPDAAAVVEGALKVAAAHGKTPADLAPALVQSLGDCWRNLASRKREVRRLPHMRAYHREFALGELACIKLGQDMLAELERRGLHAF